MLRWYVCPHCGTEKTDESRKTVVLCPVCQREMQVVQVKVRKKCQA